MNTLELQNNIIRKVLELKDTDLLLYLQSILDRSKNEDAYQLSEEERNEILNSVAEVKLGYSVEQKELDKEFEKWLKEK